MEGVTSTENNMQIIATWFEDNGFSSLAESIEDFDGGYPAAEFLADCRSDLHRAAKQDSDFTHKLYMVAMGKVDEMAAML